MLLFPACQEGQFGRNCQETCQRAQGCRGLSFCLLDPYGCSCASGWSGSRCDQGTETWVSISSPSQPGLPPGPGCSAAAPVQTSPSLRVGTG